MTLHYDSRRTSFSPDRAYRYLLCRDLGFTGQGAVMFIMLNPSTADEYANDPTIRRCVAFGKAWGFGTLQMTNLSPLRATDPKVLLEAEPEPPDVWDENLDYIIAAAGESKLVVAAWGIHGAAEGWADRVLAQLEPLKDVFCPGVTAKGFPRHPLYVPSKAKAIHYRHGGICYELPDPARGAAVRRNHGTEAAEQRLERRLPRYVGRGCDPPHARRSNGTAGRGHE